MIRARIIVAILACSLNVSALAQKSGGSGVPSGMILLSLTPCPSGFTEVGSLSGKFLQGTTAANNDVGSTGGSAAITPSGTNSAPSFTGTQATLTGSVAAPTFTGSPGTIPAETITWPAGVPAFAGTSNQVTSATSGGTPAGTNAASATSGNCAATNIAAGTGSTTACKATAPNLTVTAQTFTGSALGTHTHTLTPAGTLTWPVGVPTNGTVAFTPAGTNSVPALTINAYTPAGNVSAPTFSGNSFDPSPQFVRVIFCSEN